MPAPVEITVRTQLLKVAKELEAIQKQSQELTRSLVTAGKTIDEIAQEGTSETEKKITRTGKVMGAVLQGLTSDFKALFSMQALAGSLKLTSQISSTITQTVALSNKVQKLSGVYKMARGEQTRFVEDMTKGLGNLGLSSEVGEHALEGLAETPVRDRKALQNYAQTSGMLASAGGEQGKEGDISKLLSQALIARGKSPEDASELRRMAEAVDAARRSGAGTPSQILSQMNSLYAGLSDDLKKKVTPQGAAQLATVALSGGAGATSYLQRYLTDTGPERSGRTAMGVGNLFSEKGFDFEAFRKIASTAKGFGDGSTESGFKMAFGATAEEAKGLAMLAENLDRVKKATDEASRSTQTLRKSYDEAKTLGEAFQGNFNRLKGTFAAPIAGATSGMTSLFKETQKSDSGAAFVAGGSVVAASLLAGAGLGGVGRALGIKGASQQIQEARGQKIVDVAVTNWDEMGGLLGTVGKFAVGAGALGVGAAAGTAVASSDKASNIAYRAAIGPIGAALPDSFFDKIGEAVTNAFLKLGQKSGAIPETAGLRQQGPMPRPVRADVKVEVIDGTGRIRASAPASRGPVMGGQ